MYRPSHASSLLLLALLVGLSACVSGSLVVNKPKSPQVNQAVTELWERDLQRVAQSGDWILTRSYSLVGDVIAATTSGESVSHASIYDAERGTIIEAIRPVVREVPLATLLARNRYVVIVRPVGLTKEQRLESVARARSTVGTAFDLWGLIGLGSRDRFYCTELVVWASRLKEKSIVITPSSLLEYGETIYFSGARDSRMVQSVARASEELIARREADRDRAVRVAQRTNGTDPALVLAAQ
jgi:uncharacterized protein YycO